MIPHKTKGEVALARQYTAQEQSRLLFRNLVKKTRVFAVGPLEYCGSGFAVKPLKGEGGGKKIVYVLFSHPDSLLLPDIHLAGSSPIASTHSQIRT